MRGKWKVWIVYLQKAEGIRGDLILIRSRDILEKSAIQEYIDYIFALK